MTGSRAASPSRPGWSPTRARSTWRPPRTTTARRLGERGRRRPPQGPAASPDEDPDATSGPSSPRTSLDGIAVSAARHRPPCSTTSRPWPPAPAGRLGHPRPPRHPRRRKLAHEAALVDLDRGVTTLWLGRARHRLRRPSSRTSSSTSRRSSSTRRPTRTAVARVPRRTRSDTRPPRRRPTSASTRSLPAARGPDARRARLRRRRRVAGWPATPASARSSSTPPPSTTSVFPTRRSSAARWPRAWRISAA